MQGRYGRASMPRRSSSAITASRSHLRRQPQRRRRTSSAARCRDRRGGSTSRRDRPTPGSAAPIAVEALRVGGGDRRAPRQQLVEALELGDADRGLDVGEPVVEAEPVVVHDLHARRPALVALAARRPPPPRARRGRACRPRPWSSACSRRRRTPRGCRALPPAGRPRRRCRAPGRRPRGGPSPRAAAIRSSSSIAAG